MTKNIVYKIMSVSVFRKEPIYPGFPRTDEFVSPGPHNDLFAHRSAPVGVTNPIITVTLQ